MLLLIPKLSLFSYDMCSRLMLRLVGFLPIVVSALGSDSIGFLDDDLFGDVSPSLDSGALAFNQAAA